MKTPFTHSNGGNRGLASLIAALVLVALVPTAGVLWFMTVAMRNERLAVQARLTEVYSGHLAALQRQVTSFWQGRQAALLATASDSPASVFAAIVRAKWANSVVVYDDAGKALYPSAMGQETRAPETGEWAVARELEFQKKNFAAAAEAYGRIAEAARDLHAKARALQAQAGCLVKAGRKDDALRRLAQLAGDASLSDAGSAQGTWVVPNAQLLILKLLGSTEASGSGGARGADSESNAAGALRSLENMPEFDALRQRTRDALVQRLNDYADAELSSNQRRFLTREVSMLAPGVAVFPTLEAEELAADYLEHSPSRPTEAKLQRTPLAKVWRLPSADRTVVVLLREERLRAELATAISGLVLNDTHVTVFAPGDAFPEDQRLPSLDASELLPGWRLALSFNGTDPLASASDRQARFYLWIGVGVVVIIAMLALLVARYVAAQMRLSRLKDDLVSTVSHELRTPLASMRALVDTLAAGRFRDERQLNDYLQLLGRENLRLSHLIENFLSFSRMERGQHRFHFEPLAPASVMREAVNALKEKLEAPGCRFELQAEPDLPRIRGDAESLATVLINLLDNACKYTDGDKRITARILAEGDSVRFEVEDNGIGVVPRKREKSSTVSTKLIKA